MYNNLNFVPVNYEYVQGTGAWQPDISECGREPDSIILKKSGKGSVEIVLLRKGNTPQNQKEPILSRYREVAAFQ